MKVTHVFTEEGIHPDKLGKRIYFICSHAPYYLNVRPEIYMKIDPPPQCCNDR